MSTLFTPSGVISDTAPTYSWEMVGIASQYRLLVDGPSGTLINDWYKPSNVCDGDTGLCEVTPDSVAEEGAHSKWIKTRNPFGSTCSSRLGFGVSLGIGPATDAVPPALSELERAYRLYLPLVLKSGHSQEWQPPSGPSIDDRDQAPYPE